MRKNKKITALIMMMGLAMSTLYGCGSSKVAEYVGPQAETAEAVEEEVAESEEAIVDTAAAESEEEIIEESEITDLFEYYDVAIDQVATNLTDLQFDDSYKNAETTVISGPTDSMEKMSDGLALAGPFFTVDKEGNIIAINYGGSKYSLCGITAGMSMSEAGEIAKDHGFTFSTIEIAHGTAQIVAIYENGYMQLCITSDAEGEFGKTEESDIVGNVDGILLSKM